MLSSAGATDSWLWGRMSQPALLALLAHCPAYSYHITVHLHNPACDWSQFNEGWQSISITMFLLSICQQKHNCDEILWSTNLFSNHKEEKEFNFQQKSSYTLLLCTSTSGADYKQMNPEGWCPPLHCCEVQLWLNLSRRRLSEAECFIWPSEKSHSTWANQGLGELLKDVCGNPAFWL